MKFQSFLFRRHLDSEDEVYFVVHRHWIIMFRDSFFFLLIGLILPGVLWFFLYGITQYVNIIFPIWITFFFLRYVYKLADWYLDAWLCTSVSIIDVEWNGFFHQTSSRIPYSEVRELSWEVKGFWGSILRYGDVAISMATGGQVMLDNVQSPKKVEVRIIQIRDEILSHHRMSQADGIQSLLADVIANHIQEKGLPPRR